MSVYNMVLSMNESTVVAEYTLENRRSDSCQSEVDHDMYENHSFQDIFLSS